MTSMGMDVGGSRLRAGVVEGGRVVARVVRDLPSDRSPERVAGAIADAAKELRAPGAPVGVGLAAILRGADGHVAVSPNHGWRDVPFGEILRARLARPFVIENDMTGNAWGEYRFGAGRGARTIAAVFVGTGVGGGAVLDGRPWRGATNSAMEIGHVVADPEGPPCGCGRRGCLESLVGGRYVGPSPDWPRLGAILGRVLGGLVSLVNPERLVMGGSVWLGQPAFREAALAALTASATPPAFAAVAVVDTALRDDAGILGAADLAVGLS